ncbi:MAG: TIGR02996 domain-containing protein [Myxococcota bacterium]
MSRRDRPAPVFVHDAPPVHGASHPELEAQLRASPDDDALGQVYTDWLTEQGDPRGELAVAQRNGDGAAIERILEAHGHWRAGVDPKIVTIDWRPGRFRSLRLMNRVDWMHRGFDTARVAELLFGQAAANCLEELRVGVLRWEWQPEDLRALLLDATGRPFAPGLRVLRLGDCGDIDIDNGHHEIGAVPNLSAFERLERVTIWGSGIDLDGPLQVPALRSLALQTCGLGADTWATIRDGALPALQRLELGFGSEDYGAEVGVGDLAALLDGSALASVTDLGLMNAEFTDDLVDALLASPLLARLEALDLSMGTMTDRGADALLGARDRWAHLQRLDVSDNFLGDERVAALEAVEGPEVSATGQKEDEDPEWRYVSVAE